MKVLLILWLIVSFHAAYAQNEQYLFQDQDISVMEARSHQKIFDKISSLERKGYENKASERRFRTQQSMSENFDVKYYRTRWEVDPAVKYIKGEVTIYFKMIATGNKVTFNLTDSLIISSIKNKNQPLSYSRENGSFEVSLPMTLQAGTLDSVSIYYEGKPPLSNFGAFEISNHITESSSTPIMWTLSEPYGSSDWWPCKNDLTDKADSIDVYIVHPSIYKAASNGLLQSETLIQAGKTATHWKHRYPIASYLVCFAVTNYVQLTDQVTIGNSNVLVQTYCYPESTGAFQAGAQKAISAMIFFSNLFGDYPFKKEKYGHVQFEWGGGMEHQTASFMGGIDEGLIVHELAHQWFGDKVTCGSWNDIWLNEGFATYLSRIYFESKNPQNKVANRQQVKNFITSKPDGAVAVSGDMYDLARLFDNRLSYYKGSHLLYMLRWILGDSTFFTAVKNYINDPALAYGFATTNHLKSHLEAASGKNLTYFFDQWYTGQGYPSYQVEWSPSGNSVEVKLSQTTSHPSVGFFQLPIPLLFRNSVTAQQKLVVLDNTSNGQLFTENLGFTADVVEFDPEVLLITKNNVLTKVSGPLPVTFRSFEARCNGAFPRLVWETSEEINADYFEIQRSTDAVSWEKIGSVNAVGNSNLKNAYDFVDAWNCSQKTYYRITEHDLDGKTQQTRIVAAQCNATEASQAMLSPNPVGDHIDLNVPDAIHGPVSIEIYDVSGIVRQREKKLFAADQKSIKVSTLPSGIYLLKWTSGNQKDSGVIRFLKE